MNNKDMNSIFEQINNLKKSDSQTMDKTTIDAKDSLREVLGAVSERNSKSDGC